MFHWCTRRYLKQQPGAFCNGKITFNCKQWLCLDCPLNKIFWCKRRGAFINCGQLNELFFIQHSLRNKMSFSIYARDFDSPVTFACFSISIKSIFARAVIGSLGVVTHSIDITVVCSFSTLVYIWSNRKHPLALALINVRTMLAWFLFLMFDSNHLVRVFH